MQTFIDYVNWTWMKNSTWSVNELSILEQAVHINNDFEGWHHRFNHRAHRSRLPFYLLTELLYSEARNVGVQMTMLSEAAAPVHTTMLCRCQRWIGEALGAIPDWPAESVETASSMRMTAITCRESCQTLSGKLPTLTQTNEQSQTIIASRYFKHDLLLCALYIFYCHWFS